VAAFTGRADVMEALAWGGVLHYGTQNASRIGLHAARASLQVLADDDGAAFRHLWKIGELLGAGLRAALAESRRPAIVQQVGPMLQIMFTDRPAIRDYREFCAHVDRDAYRRLAWALFRLGVYLTPSAALHSVSSLAHTEDDVRCTVDAVRKALRDG
jgi:glutamate-1-semialdehyde 2,1-aminomutase